MSFKDKILSREALASKIAQLKKKGKRVAFTNGCFDILHFGHVSYLELAKTKTKADILIVGINSDASVRVLKGRSRPIVPQKERASVIAALACVDFVVIFKELTPAETVQALKPDILIKGADWRGRGIAGAEEVKSWGGKVVFIRFIHGCSTTAIIEKIQEECKAQLIKN